MRVGFIGVGTMGGILLEKLLEKGETLPEQMVLFDHNPNKLKVFKDKWPELEIAQDNIQLAEKSDICFLCVEPMDAREIIIEISPHLNPEAHLVTIVAGLETGVISKVFSGYITKVVPGVNIKGEHHVALIYHRNVPPEKEALVNSFFSSMGNIRIINEDEFEPIANLTSVGPALLASFFIEFAKMGVKHSSLSQEEAENLVLKTAAGTLNMLLDQGVNCSELISSVATPGGITEEGIKVMENMFPPVLQEIFNKTLGKHEILKGRIRKQFQE